MNKKIISKRHQKQLRAFGMFLRELRLAHGLTQKELSQHVELNLKTIQRIESGKNTSLLSILIFGEYFSLDVMSELFG